MALLFHRQTIKGTNSTNELDNMAVVTQIGTEAETHQFIKAVYENYFDFMFVSLNNIQFCSLHISYYIALLILFVPFRRFGSRSF